MPTPMMEPIRVCDEEAGKPSAPGAQVPDDRGEEECEHHRETGVGTDLEDQLDRQQRDDAERDRAADKSTPKKLKKPDQTTAT